MSLLKNQWIRSTLEAAAIAAGVDLFFTYTASGRSLEQWLHASFPTWFPWVLLGLFWLILGLGVYRKLRNSNAD